LNISIKHLEHFVAVAQELHFRRAAELANVAQPALSRSVQTLENELGVQLLARNNRNVRLTAAGEQFLSGCTSIIEAMDETIAKSVRAGQAEFGGLLVGYTYIAMGGILPKLIADFETQYPSIPIEPVEISSHDQLESLHEVSSSVFQNDGFVVIANNTHHFANRNSISVEELSKEKILLCSDSRASVFNQHVNNFFKSAGLEPDFKYMDRNHIGLLGMVTLNRGICIATSGYGCVYANNLKTLKITGIDASLPTVMAWRKDLQSESVNTFRNFILDNSPKTQSSQAPSTSTPAVPEIS